MNRKWTRIAALAGALAPSFASATLLIDDGGSHLINTLTSQSVLISNGSAVDVGSGGSIVGDGSNTSPLTRGAISTLPFSNSSIHLSGNAQVSAGTEQYAIARSMGGNLFLTGNSQVNGDIFGFATTSPPASPSLRTYVGDSAVINGNIHSDGLLQISGNALITGGLFEANGGIALEMNGGVIQGHVNSSSLVGHSALIYDGAILGGYGGNASNIDFSIHGGVIDGGWAVNSQDMLVEVRGGQINGGMRFGSIADPTAIGSVSIFSGAIDALAGGWLFDFTSGFDPGGATSFDCSANTSRFDIWGGQLGFGSAGNGVHLDYCATLDVYGTNLSYAGGLLTGLLADGSLLNLSVTEESRWSGQVRLHDTSVPEPGTLGLFGMALGAAAFMRRRKSATHAR